MIVWCPFCDYENPASKRVFCVQCGMRIRNLDEERKLARPRSPAEKGRGR